MGEYLLTVLVPQGSTQTFPIPAAGIAGVYADGTVGIAWNFNGVVADLKTAAEWEPLGGFHPAATSALVFDNSSGSANVNVTVRCYEKTE